MCTNVLHSSAMPTLSPSPLPHAHLLTQVMDALKMDFPDNTFDLVWACESGEHMPDKKKCDGKYTGRYDMIAAPK